MRNRTWIMVAALLIVMVLSGCTRQNQELALGRYMSEDRFSWVILEENERFLFSRAIYDSYLPLGSYQVDGDTLILHVSDDEEYLFTIESEKLIFTKSNCDASGVEPGTEYTYDADWNE